MSAIAIEAIGRKPVLGTPGSAGYDLRVRGQWVISPGQCALIPTGTNIHINTPTLCGLLLPRSSLFGKTGLILTNGAGVIDSDYQGEIMVSLLSTKRDGPAILNDGERFCQLVLTRVETNVEWSMCNVFSGATDRGEGGIGSTG